MPILAKKIIFSDEAHWYDRGGYVNKPNCRKRKRIIVWCGFWIRGISGPFFFENEQGEAVTVNDDRYRAMLNEFLFTKIEEKGIDYIWFHQDGVTCHTAEATLDVLRSVFEDRIISRRANVGAAISHR